MEIENREQVYSLQRSMRVCTVSLLQRLSTTSSRTSSSALEECTFAMDSELTISITRTDSVCFAATSTTGTAASLQSSSAMEECTFAMDSELTISITLTDSVYFAATSTTGTAASLQSDADTGPFPSGANPFDDAVDAARASWRYATAPVGEAGDDIDERHTQLRGHVEQRVPPRTFLAPEPPTERKGGAHCERVIAEIDSQDGPDPKPSAGGAGSAVTCKSPRPAAFTSEDVPTREDTSTCQTTTPGDPATGFTTGVDVDVPVRRYFPLCFAATSSPFSYPETSGSIPSQSFRGEYPPAHSSSHFDWKSADVLEAAAEQSSVRAPVAAAALAQSSAVVDQCFFVTLPGKHGVPMSYYAPAAAASAAAHVSGRHALVADTAATAAVVPIPDGKDETTTLIIPASSAGSGFTHADMWGHSLHNPLTKYRVHCRLVSTNGSRQQYIVETEPVETSLHDSTLPPISSAAGSGYMDARLAEGIEENFVTFRKRRARKGGLRQSRNHFVLEQLKEQEALSTTSTPYSPMPDLDADDTRSMSEDDEQHGITAYHQKCLRDNKELRRLHECLNALPACVAFTEGRESTNKSAVDFATTCTTRPLRGGTSTSPRVDLLESPKQISSLPVPVPIVSATASQSPNFTSMTPAPSSLSNAAAVFHDCPVAYGVPAALLNSRRAPSEAVSPLRAEICAAQTVGHTRVHTHNGATLPVTVRKDSLHQGTDAVNNLDDSASKGRGLRARRPPPLDPELLEQGLEVMAIVFVPSPYSVSPPSFSLFSTSEVASPNFGTQREMRTSPFNLPMNESAEDSSEEQQLRQGMSRPTPFLSASPVAAHGAVSASPAIRLARGCYNDAEDRSNDFQLQAESTSVFSSSGGVSEKIVSHSEFSGCSNAYCAVNDIGKIQKHGNETQHENQQVQEMSICLQDSYDISQLPASWLDHEHMRRIRMNSAARSANMARWAVSKSVEKRAQIHGLAANASENIQSDTSLRRYSAMSPPRKRLRTSEILVVDTEQETRTPEDFSKSQHSFLSVPQKTETHTAEGFSESECSYLSVRQETEASPATWFATESHMARTDRRADDWTFTDVTRQSQGLSEEVGLPTLRLSTSPNRNTRNIYNWRECGTRPHQEMWCTAANSIQEQKQEDRHAKNQKRWTSAAAQAEQVLSTTSTVQFSDRASECCTRSAAKLNEHGDKETGLMTSKECSPAVRGLFSISVIDGRETVQCGIRECATQPADERGATQFQGKDRYSYRPSSASVPPTIVPSAAAHRRYPAVPSKFFADAKKKDTAANSQERLIPSDEGLHLTYWMASSAQNPNMCSTTSLLIDHCHEPPISVLAEKPQERSGRQDEIQTSRNLPAGVGVPTRWTSEADNGVSFEYCVDTDTNGGALKEIRSTRTVTPLSAVSEKEKDSVVLNECSSTSLLKQYCSRTVHMIKKKRAQEQQGRQLERVGPTMLPDGQSTARISVAAPSGRHYSVDPPVRSIEFRLNQPGESCQLNPFEEVTAVEGTSRVAHALSGCTSAARSRASLCSSLERSGEYVSTDALQDNAGTQIASTASEIASALDRHCIVANPGHPPTIRPRRLSQSAHANPLQEPTAGGSAPRATSVVSRRFTVAPPGCPITSRRKGSDKGIRASPLKETAAVETIPGLLLGLPSSCVVALSVSNAYSHPKHTFRSTQENTLQYTADVQRLPDTSNTGARQHANVEGDRGCSVVQKPRPSAQFTRVNPAHETSELEAVPRDVADLHRCCRVAPPRCAIGTEAHISRKCIHVNPLQEAPAVETSRPMADEGLPCAATALPPGPIDPRLEDTEQCSQRNTQTIDARNAFESSEAASALHRNSVPATRRRSIRREPNRLAKSTEMKQSQMTLALKTTPRATPHLFKCVAVNRAGSYIVPQMNEVERCTQISPFKKTAGMERVSQETSKVSTRSGVVPGGPAAASLLASTTQHVRMSTPPPTVDVPSASTSSRASSPPRRQYKTATRGRSIARKPRRRGQISQGSLLQEIPPVAPAAGLIHKSPACFATALPETADVRLRAAGKFSQTDLSKEVDAAKGASRAPVALERRFAVAPPGAPIPSKTGCPVGIARVNWTRAPLSLERRFAVAPPGAPITSRTRCPVGITLVKATRAPVALERRFAVAPPGAPITSRMGYPVTNTRVKWKGEENGAKKF